MKMAELSSRSGIPVPTIKMYLREELLPAGERVNANQARYGEAHLRRLRLIQALLKVGGLSVASARGVLAAIDSDLALGHVFGIAATAASQNAGFPPLAENDHARADELIPDWHCSREHPARSAIAAVVRAFDDAGEPFDTRWGKRYAEAAMLVAQADLDSIDRKADRESKAVTVVIGTVLGDTLFGAMRRLAQQHVSHERYPAPQPERAQQP